MEHTHIHTHSMTVAMDNHRHVTHLVGPYKTPSLSLPELWVASYTTHVHPMLSKLISFPYAILESPEASRHLPRNWSHKSLSLVVQVLVVWWKHDLGWWMGVVGLRVNRSAKVHWDRSWHGLYNPPPVGVEVTQEVFEQFQAVTIYPQVPSIFVDHIPEAGRISMTFAQQFQDI